MSIERTYHVTFMSMQTARHLHLSARINGRAMHTVMLLTDEQTMKRNAN
ncbi:MAG: hypothetical protein PHO64_15180 [Thiomonas sp.]|nr:hypothetical protein [Thiomonas sp.]